MRWSLKLHSPVLVAAASQSAAPVLRLGPDKDGRTAEISISAGPDALVLDALATEPAHPAPLPPYAQWYNRAHLVVFLNPGHDHATRWMYAVDDAGTVIAQAEHFLPGEEPGDELARRLDSPPQAQGAFQRLDARHFQVSLRVPLSGLAREAAPIGLALKVGFYAEIIPQPLQWPEPVRWAGSAPLVFGDLYMRAPPLRIERAEFPAPAWSPAESCVELHGRCAEVAAREGIARVQISLPGDTDPPAQSHAWRADGDALALRLPVSFPSRAKWANELLSTARLNVALEDGSGRTLWQAGYPFGFDAGVIVRERYGPQGRALSPRPSPSAPDFLDGLRAHLLARLPDFRARTTREGAPSDFFLEDPTGEASLDLSAADALDRAAELLAQRFPDWQDALYAAALLAHHRCVTRHSSSWARLSGQATLATLPRLGGCFCNDVSRLLASLAERVGARLHVPLKGYVMGLSGHLTTLVATPHGRVVIDGMLGMAFHTLDNARLATLEEMRAEARIATRVWFAPRAHGHEFFYHVQDQTINDWQDGALEWPAASPS